ADYVGLKQRAGQGVAGLHFSLLLLREVFEWDDLQPVAGWQLGEADYPITHRAFGGAVPLILKGWPRVIWIRAWSSSARSRTASVHPTAACRSASMPTMAPTGACCAVGIGCGCCTTTPRW
ncbi:MAG: hypothetical protein WCH37_01190, partial [Synechococcaceae cyanobacterium ELA182]